MNRATLLLLLASVTASPAFATGDLVCGNGKDVSVDLLVGSTDTLSIARATIAVGDKSWSTQPEIMPGKPIAVGQGYSDDRQLTVDFTDEGLTEIVGRLRVVKASEGDTNVSGGVFALKGEGAWVVDCSAGE